MVMSYRLYQFNKFFPKVLYRSLIQNLGEKSQNWYNLYDLLKGNLAPPYLKEICAEGVEPSL